MIRASLRDLSKSLIHDCKLKQYGSEMYDEEMSYLTQQPAARIYGYLIPYTSVDCHIGTSHTLHVSWLTDRDISYPTRQPAAR